MRLTLIAASIATAAFAAPALANGHSQPASNGMAIYAYPSQANYCPAGLQPVMLGGVICCGVPTHHGNPYAHPVKRSHKPTTYVSYGKGATDVVVYGKGN